MVAGASLFHATLTIVLVVLLAARSSLSSAGARLEQVEVKASAFADLDSGDFYEDELVAIEEAQESLGIRFKPPQLLFDNSPICIPAIAQFEVHNVLDHSVDILAVTSSDRQFHPVLFSPQMIGPEESIVVQILFLPYFLDSSSSELVVETSEGSLYYRVEGKAVANPYHLHPFLDNKVVLGSTNFNIPVHIYNPHSTTLHIMEVFTTEDFISLADSQSISQSSAGASAVTASSSRTAKMASQHNNSVDIAWSIASGAEELLMTLNIGSVKTPGFQRGYVHVKTDHDKMIIPIEIEFIPVGLRLVEPSLDFGVLFSPNEQKSLDLLVVNDGDDNVRIVDIVVEGQGEGLTVVFDDELMIYAGKPYTKVANAIFRSADLKVGQYVGKLVIYTNSSSTVGAILEVPFGAIVLHGGIGFDVESLVFNVDPQFVSEFTNYMGQEMEDPAYNPEDSAVCVGTNQSVFFQNQFSSSITIFGAQMQTCQDLIHVFHGPPGQELLPLQPWGPLQLTFCSEKIVHRFATVAGFLPRTCWMDLNTNVSTQRIPVYLTDGRLEVELIDAVAKMTSSSGNSTGSLQSMLWKDPFDSEFFIDFGIQSRNQPRDVRIVVSNRNSVSNHVGLDYASHGTCACFESSWPIEYFNDLPGELESYVCSWPSRNFAYASAFEHSRCSCHNETYVYSANDTQGARSSSLQAKLRPGYSALLTLTFRNFTDLPPPVSTMKNGQLVDVYTVDIRLRSKVQKITLRIQFAMLSQEVLTVPDEVNGNKGHFVLGQNTYSLFWSTAALPAGYDDFVFSSDSALMDARFSSVRPMDNASHWSVLPVLQMDETYSQSEERLYGPIRRVMWSTAIALDVASKPSTVKCLEERLHVNPLLDTPSMWSLMLGIFCAVGRSDKFTAQWVEAVRRIEASKAFPIDLNIVDMRALTVQLRVHWLQIHGVDLIDLPPASIVAKSPATTHLHLVNNSKLEVPLVFMPTQYSVHLPHAAIGQPMSIYLDIVNPHDVDSKIAFFRIIEPTSSFVFHHASKTFCDNAVDSTQPVDLSFAFEERTLQRIQDDDGLGSSEPIEGKRSGGGDADDCSLVPKSDCMDGACKISAEMYLRCKRAKSHLISRVVARQWNLRSSSTGECPLPSRSPPVHHGLNVTIPPRSSMRLGPIIFTPDAMPGKEYKGNFFIFNSFSGYEQLEITAKTEKPVLAIEHVQLCDEWDRSQGSCLSRSNHSQTAADWAPSSPNKSHPPLPQQQQRHLVVSSPTSSAQLLLRNIGNATMTIWDIEVDGKRRVLDCTNEGSLIALDGRLTTRSAQLECASAPHRLAFQQELLVELPDLLSCSYLSKRTRLRIFDQGVAEPVIDLDLTVRASDDFVDHCLNGQSWASRAGTLIVLVMLLVGSGIVATDLSRQCWSLLAAHPAPNGQLPSVPSWKSLASGSSPIAILSQTQLLAGLTRSRTISEDASGGTAIMDLSDVRDLRGVVQVAPNAFCEAAKLKEQRRSASSKSALVHDPASPESRSHELRTAYPSLDEDASRQSARRGASPKSSPKYSPPNTAFLNGSPPRMEMSPAPSPTPSPKMRIEAAASPIGGALGSVPAYAQAESVAVCNAHSNDHHDIAQCATGEGASGKEEEEATDDWGGLSRAAGESEKEDIEEEEVEEEEEVDALASPSQADSTVKSGSSKGRDPWMSLRVAGGHSHALEDEDGDDAVIREAFEVTMTNGSEDTASIHDPPPLALVSDLIHQSIPTSPRLSVDVTTDPFPGSDLSFPLSLNLNTLGEEPVIAIDTGVEHQWGSAKSSPVKPPQWTARSVHIDAPPGLPPGLPSAASASPLRAVSHGSDGTDSPLFTYRGQLLETDSSFTPSPLYPPSSLPTPLMNPAGAQLGSLSNPVMFARPVVHEVLVSQDERIYLQNLMSSTREDDEQHSQSWERIFADLEDVRPRFEADPPVAPTPNNSWRVAPPQPSLQPAAWERASHRVPAASAAPASYSSRPTVESLIDNREKEQVPQMRREPMDWQSRNAYTHRDHWESQTSNSTRYIRPTQRPHNSQTLRVDRYSHSHPHSHSNRFSPRMQPAPPTRFPPPPLAPTLSGSSRMRTSAGDGRPIHGSGVPSVQAHHRGDASFFGPSAFFDDDRQDSTFGSLEENR